MQDWTDNNPHINNVLAALQPMEEITGPSTEEYIAIMTHLQEEIEQRIVNAKKARK